MANQSMGQDSCCMDTKHWCLGVGESESERRSFHPVHRIRGEEASTAPSIVALPRTEVNLPQPTNRRRTGEELTPPGAASLSGRRILHFIFATSEFST
jgi:hypothetical protein